MRRKINKVGQDTLTVSIPKDWAVRNDLKKGDEVDIDIREDMIAIFGKNKMSDKTAEFASPPHAKTIYRILKFNYIMGINELKLNFDKKETVKLIEKETKHFIGFEIIERTDKYCIIRTIADIREGEFDKVLKKLFSLVHLMGTQIHESLKKGKTANLSHIDSLEETVNKLYVFCQRYINTAGWRVFKTPTLYYIFIQKLENMADNFTFISEHYRNKKVNVHPQTLDFLQDVLAFLQRIQNYYYNFSIDDFKNVYLEKKEMIDRGIKLYKSLPREELLLIGKLLDIIKLMWEAASPIFDIGNLGVQH